MKAWTVSLFSICTLVCGCGTELHDAAQGIDSPIERGLMYVATAIVFHGLFRLMARLVAAWWSRKA